MTKTVWARCCSAMALMMMVIGIQGCPKTEDKKPCDGACSAVQTCNTTTNACESSCKGKCTNGQGCNEGNGKCEFLCTTKSVVCSADKKCVDTTGECVSKCDGVTCSADKECVAATGLCADKCKACDATKQDCIAANPVATRCVNRCETETKPAGKAACSATQKCSPSKGTCVGLCDEEKCPFQNQFCDPTNGQCREGKPPTGFIGSACATDTECSVNVTAATGQTASCKTKLGETSTFEGGYCSVSCGTALACPNGAYCLGLDGGSCIDVCSKESECRTGYACLANFLLQIGSSKLAGGVCLPGTKCDKADPTQCGKVGSDCAKDTDCGTNQQCADTEIFSGNKYDNGYCTKFLAAEDVCPAGSTKVPLQSAAQDIDFALCLKSCSSGTITGCGLGEQCGQLTQTTSACIAGDCATDAACEITDCSATRTTDCGKGQTCTIPTGETNGTCSTIDTCSNTSPCVDGSTCTNGLCAKPYCEPSLRQCLNACDPTKSSTTCPANTVCNATTRRCDRGCTTDAQCGNSGLCNGSKCVAKCSIETEKAICGDAAVCDTSTGACMAKCNAPTEPTVCEGTTPVCNATSGRCQASCDPAQPNFIACDASQYCDVGNKVCKTKCSLDSECSATAGEYCQISTGKCLANCKADATICGADACTSFDDASSACGRKCSSAANCGASTTNNQITCATITGLTIKSCQRIKCTPADAAQTCGGATLCDANGFCLIAP